MLGTKAIREKRSLVSMQAAKHTIIPSKQEKLLGCIVSDNLKWKPHILDHEQSLVRQLTRRVNGLAMITFKADFKTKLMVANGLVMSKVCYLIQLWGGCEGYLLKALQVQVNKAARSVTGLSGFTSTKKLMQKCGWLTVKQLVQYQAIIMVHKTLHASRPLHMYSRLHSDYSYSTRQHSTGCIRLDHNYMCRGDLPKNSFRYRGAHYYNALSAQIRTVRNMNTF